MCGGCGLREGIVRILYAVTEVSPFSKTGGLADVAGSLPTALSRLGHEVQVVTPKYRAVDEKKWSLKTRGSLQVSLAGKIYRFDVWEGSLPRSNVPVFFLGDDFLFNREGLYQENGLDYPDNLERFSSFSRAILELPRFLNRFPDILHANDWQTALSLAYLKARFSSDPPYVRIGTLFTIHNLAYQGLFPGIEFQKLDLPPHFFSMGLLEFFGGTNFLKSGLVFADYLNTVSPTYCREILTPELGQGLQGVLLERRERLSGVLNGVDYEQWDPRGDPHLPANYDAGDLSGKAVCKKALRREMGLPVYRGAVIGMITRLIPQKGIDLVLDVLDEMMRLDLQMVILGAGEPVLQHRLMEAAARYPRQIAVRLGFDEELAHRIEAGSDMLLMPSRYEPCGLNQLYSLRYGTIPIVRATGGLADSVADALPSHLASGSATGFAFESLSGHALLTTLRLALTYYRNRAAWKGIVRTAMEADFSWDRSAREYSKLYERIKSDAP